MAFRQVGGVRGDLVGDDAVFHVLIVALFSAAGIALGSASAADSSNAAKGEKKEAVTEALVRQRVEDWAKAVRAKDIDGVMSLYETKNVSFDLDPPLRYAGADNKRRTWQEFFAARTGPIAYQVREFNVTAHGELAFAHIRAVRMRVR